MTCKNQSEHGEIRQALKELRGRTAASLKAFNDTVPYASWIRRSEIERLTGDLLRVAERASRRHQPTRLENIKNALCRIARLGAAVRLT